MEYLLIEEEGDTSIIDTTGLSRRELSRQFIRLTAEAAQLQNSLDIPDVAPGIREAQEERLVTVRSMSEGLMREWLGRVAKGEPVGPRGRDIHPNTPESPF